MNSEQQNYASRLRQVWDLQNSLIIPTDPDKDVVRRKGLENIGRWESSDLRKTTKVIFEELIEPIAFTPYYKSILKNMLIDFPRAFAEIELSHTPVDELIVNDRMPIPEEAKSLEENALKWYLGYEKLPGATREYSLNRRHLERYIKGGKDAVIKLESDGHRFFNSIFGLTLSLELWEAIFFKFHGYTPRDEK